VVARDGVPLPPGYIIALKPVEAADSKHPKVKSHNFFQKGQAFLDSGGCRGPQLDTLQPGVYYINPYAFTRYFVPTSAVTIDWAATRTDIRKEDWDNPNLAKDEQERIRVEERKARADLQGKVVEAKLSIDISTNKAEAVRKEAEGIRDATKTKADGEAYQQRQVGQGIADAFASQANVIGPERLALLKILGEVAAGKVKIIPDVLVSGKDEQGGNLFSAWLAA